jgi:hypothetical protein
VFGHRPLWTLPNLDSHVPLDLIVHRRKHQHLIGTECAAAQGQPLLKAAAWTPATTEDEPAELVPFIVVEQDPGEGCAGPGSGARRIDFGAGFLPRTHCFL